MPTKGSPRCVFCKYSERISREPRNSGFIYCQLEIVLTVGETEILKVKAYKK